MTIPDIFLLLVILILAIKISYEDIKRGKIRNKWVLMGAGAGMIIYLVLIFLGLFKIIEINWLYFRDVLINTLIAFFVGIVIWHLGFWTAGDAKLFSLLAFLLPLDYYSKAYIKYFPSFALLYNIFIPIFAWLIIRGIIYRLGILIDKIPTALQYPLERLDQIAIGPRRPSLFEKGAARREIGGEQGEHLSGFLPRFLRQPKEIWRKMKEGRKEQAEQKGERHGFFGFLGFIIIFLFLMIVRRGLQSFLVQIMIPQMIIFVLLLFAFKPIHKFFQKNKKAVYLVIILLIGYFIFGFVFFKEHLVSDLKSLANFNFLIFIFAIPFLNKLADFYIKKTEVRKIPLEKLTSKMILTEETIGLVKQDKNFFEEKIERFYPDGLTKNQVSELKNWFKNKKEEQIEIYKTFPFAPFIFLGVIITIILGGSIYHIFFR